MIKSKNKKILTSLVAGISICSNLLPLSAEYRGPDSHEYGGGCSTVTTPSSGSGGGSTNSGATGNSSSGSTTSPGAGSNSGSSSSNNSSSGGKTGSSGSSTSSGGSGNTSSSGGNSSSGTQTANKPNNGTGTNNGSNIESENGSSATGNENQNSGGGSSTTTSSSSSGSSSSGSGSQSSGPSTTELLQNATKEELIYLKTQIENYISAFWSGNKKLLAESSDNIKTFKSSFVRDSSPAVKNVSERVFPEKTVGDPVMITAGKFFTSDTDLTLDYGSSVFEITRFYTSQDYPNGALGKNWASVFDSRIIRGTGVENCAKLKNMLSEYESNYESLCSTLRSTGLNPEFVQEAKNVATQISDLKNQIEKIENAANINPDLNKYVAHGFENTANKLNPDNLIMVDSDGSVYSFEYSSEKNNYQGVSKNVGSKIFVENEDGGFVVHYIDGTLKHFDKWGMLVKIEDRFSSSIEFEYFSSINNNVRRVHSILKNDIPVVDVEWKDNRISKITDLRKSISVSYSYNGNGSLISFVDSDGDVYGYTYDSGLDLVKMLKPDGTFIKIDYSVNGSDRKKRVSAVTNEEGFEERFSIDEQKGKTIFTDADGNQYIYNFSDDEILHEEVSEDYFVNRTYNERGLVETLSDPYKKVSYSYDEYRNLISAKYDDGTSENWTYIQPYNLLSSYKNRDGVTTEFLYSENGGLEKIKRDGVLIQSYTRDSAGRVVHAKGINKNEDYVYDSNGLLIADNHGVYRYDSRDRIVAYETKDGYSWTFSYTDDNKIQTAVLPGNLFEKNEYNSRKDLIKKTQIDLVSGETRIYEYGYDSRHLLSSIKVGCGKNSELAEKNIHLTRTLDYYPSGKVKTLIDWNQGEAVELDAAGVKRTYTYKKDNVSKIKVNFVDSSGKEFGKSYEKLYDVSYSDGKKIMTITDALGNSTTVRFNAYGSVEKIIDPLGRSVSSVYSAAGFLKNETGAYGGQVDYEWDNASGQINKISDSYSKVVDYIYDENGKLKSEKYINGEKNEYEYSEKNGLTTVTKKSALYNISTVYDSMGVEIAQKIVDASGKTVYEKNISIDRRNNIVSQDIGNVHLENKIDAWGNLSEDFATGAKYSYDENGNCISIKNGNVPVEISYNVFNKISSIKIGERFTKYCYDAGENLLKVFDNVGTIAEYSYDVCGNLVSEKGRVKTERKYEYDKSGNLVKISEAGKPVQSFEYSKDFRVEKIIDAKGNARTNEYDAYGNLISVTDRLGKKRTVSINRTKGSTIYTDFNGKKLTVTKSANDNSIVKTFADGDIEKIVYDSLGSISKMENAFGNQRYSFDSSHNLSTVFDGENKIDYSYDNFGRLVSMRTNNHNYDYEYYGNGILKSLGQGDFKRTFDYDDFGQLVQSCDNSSSKICYEYDEIGRPVLTYQKDRAGNIVFAEGTVYGEDGRVLCNFDKDGNLSTYEYDDHGRIVRVCLPFVQPYFDEAKSELEECGKSAYTSMILEIANVDSSTKASVKNLLNKIGLSSCALDGLQEVWVETYSYDANGNRISKNTPAGKMEYEYDAENRLVKILGPSPVTISYDANGNMLSRKSDFAKSEWKYSQNNRVVASSYSDYAADVYSASEYGYDCMGRRVFVKDSNGTCVRSLYDGFTFDKIYEWQDKGNSYSSQLWSGNTNSKIRFRNIEGNYSGTERSYRDASQKSCPFDRYYLYANGSPVAQFNERYSYGERLVNEDVFSFCTDGRGTVRVALGESGDFVFGMNYGLNGQPHFSMDKNLSGNFVSCETAASFGADIGFNGKQFDSRDGTYNYGFRSYSPSLGIFVTEDPIQDGENWYSYCKGDPVNYADALGLKNIPADMVGLMDEYGENILLGNSSTVRLDQQGCYVTVIAGIINTVKHKTGDERFTPLTINDEKTNFLSTNHWANSWSICENYKIKYIEYGDGYTYRQIADKINDFDESSTDYCLAVKFEIPPKTESGKTWPHWVTTDTGTVNIDGEEYVKVIGTHSKWDCEASRKGWIDRDGATYAPIDQLKGVRAFQNDEKETVGPSGGSKAKNELKKNK